VLAEERPERALGGAMAWARQMQVEEVHVVAQDAAGLLARRAQAFSSPPRVWRASGRSLAPASPEPLRAQPPLSDDVQAFVPVLERAGAEAVVEHGVLAGEVLGLEVARVVVDELGAYLSVGVGKHDREAHRIMNADRPPGHGLEDAVSAVRAVRDASAPSHQMNRLARERWLRAVLVGRPAAVGASWLRPVPSPVRRSDLRQPAPAPAAGVDTHGRPLLVVCSTGIDVDLVPSAVDARLADPRQPRMVLALPEGDDHPVTRALAEALVSPAEVVTIPGEWRRL
jgi:hypothetical protein